MLSPLVKVGDDATVSYSVVMPGAVIGAGAVVEYAIVGENVTIGPGAHVGCAPDGTEEWNIATLGPNVHVKKGAQIPAGAMIYAEEEA